MSRGHIFTRERGGGDRGGGSYIDEGAHRIPSEVCFALFLFWNRSNWIRKIRQRFKTISRCFAFICKTKVSQVPREQTVTCWSWPREKKGYGISQFCVLPKVSLLTWRVLTASNCVCRNITASFQPKFVNNSSMKSIWNSLLMFFGLARSRKTNGFCLSGSVTAWKPWKHTLRNPRRSALPLPPGQQTSLFTLFPAKFVRYQNIIVLLTRIF